MSAGEDRQGGRCAVRELLSQNWPGGAPEENHTGEYSLLECNSTNFQNKITTIIITGLPDSCLLPGIPNTGKHNIPENRMFVLG
jgi:hypothetical protein